MSERTTGYEIVGSKSTFVNHIRYLEDSYDLDPELFLSELSGYSPSISEESEAELSGGFVLLAGDRFVCEESLLSRLSNKRRLSASKNILIPGVDLEALERGYENCEVMVKYVSPPAKGRISTGAQMRGLKEARIHSELNHPNIVEVLDNAAEMIQGRYVPGFVMEKLYPLQGPFSLYDISTIVNQMADALDYAHAQGVFHRDVQVGNILTDNNGRYALTDFQIAHTRTLKPGEENTPMYCLRYADPQQIAMEDVELKEQGDVHALAVTAYNLLSRDWYPYGIQGHRHADQQLRAIDRSGIPEVLRKRIEEVLQVATSFHRHDRFRTCGEFAAAFTPCLTTGIDTFDRMPLN